MSFNELLKRITSTVHQELVERFNAIVLRLAKGGTCEYYSFFDRLNEPIKDNLGNELTEFTILNKTSVIGNAYLLPILCVYIMFRCLCGISSSAHLSLSLHIMVTL